MSKALEFRELLRSEGLEFVCEVHNALSARIVQEAGFRAMWGSSLTISAAMGLRDNNEATWTQVLEVLEFICDGTSIPLLLDADTGYGNFNTVRRLTRKLGQRGVAAMCMEDKIFPKANSFIGSERQPLAEIDEFCGKIKAAKDTQPDRDFSVVARVEALITGWGLGEALKRAEAYHEAGADAILIHSKSSQPDEVLAFKREWGDRSPVVIIPTKYYTTPTEVFREAGISMVIWANMILRSSIRAMQETASKLQGEQSLLNIEDSIVPMTEVFRLQGSEELEQAEKLYLPKGVEDISTVILAASRGADLGELTADRPKAMLSISGRPLLYRQVDRLNEIGIKNITVVRGYKKELIDAPNLKYLDNDDYAETQEAYSLNLALQGLEGTVLVCYGDILYKKYIPYSLLETEGDIVAVVDADWEPRRQKGRYTDFVSCDQPYNKYDLDQEINVTSMGTSLKKESISGEWIGMLKLSERGSAIVKDLLTSFAKSEEGLGKVRMADLINEIVAKGHRVKAHFIRGHWLDIDELKDFIDASTF